MNLLEILGLCLILYSDCVSSTTSTESACEELSDIFPNIDDKHFKTNNNDTIREKLLERTINVPLNGTTEIKSLPCVPKENSTEPEYLVPEQNTTVSNSINEAQDCIEIPMLFSNFTDYKISEDPDKRAELEAKTIDVHKSDNSRVNKIPCAPKNFDHYKLLLKMNHQRNRIEQDEQPPSPKQKPILVKVLVGTAASVLSIAILYLGFIKFKKNFRRILTNQNGNREILINEFDDVELQENKFIV